MKRRKFLGAASLGAAMALGPVFVREAFASSVRNGPPALRLPGRRTQVFATFVFTVRPKGKGIVARWVLPSGTALPGVPQASGPRARSSRCLKRSTGSLKGTRVMKSRVRTRFSFAT